MGQNVEILENTVKIDSAYLSKILISAMSVNSNSVTLVCANNNYDVYAKDCIVDGVLIENVEQLEEALLKIWDI